MMIYNMKRNLFFFFILLLFPSCASWTTTDKSFIRSDSLRQTTRLSIRQIAVPKSHADLQIPAAGLRDLPPAALYTAKSGQATATVRFLYDTLFVSASCDSLQALVYRYETEIEEMNGRVEAVTKKTQACNGFRWLVVSVILGIIICFLKQKG